jgi:hypothetical protein
MLGEEYGDDLDQYRKDVRKLGELVKAVDDELALFPAVSPAARWAGDGARLREAWKGFDDDEKRAIIEDAFGRITIHNTPKRGKGIDPDRVGSGWTSRLSEPRCPCRVAQAARVRAPSAQRDRPPDPADVWTAAQAAVRRRWREPARRRPLRPSPDCHARRAPSGCGDESEPGAVAHGAARSCVHERWSPLLRSSRPATATAGSPTTVTDVHDPSSPGVHAEPGERPRSRALDPGHQLGR